MSKRQFDAEDALDGLLWKVAVWVGVSYCLGAAAALAWGFL